MRATPVAGWWRSHIFFAVKFECSPGRRCRARLKQSCEPEKRRPNPALLDFLLMRCAGRCRAVRARIDESIKGNMLRHARTRSSLFCSLGLSSVEIIKVLKSTADVARKKIETEQDLRGALGVI